MNQEHVLTKLIKLRGAMEHFVFKSYLRTYPLPDNMNQTHSMTIMIIKHHEGLSMSEVSTILGMEKGSFTSVADKMIKMGYLVSERSEKDRRRYILKLTDKALDFANEFKRKHALYIEEQIGGLEQNKKDDFEITVDKMLNILEDLLDQSECGKVFHK